MDETNLIGSLRRHNGDFLRNAFLVQNDPFLYFKKSLYTANIGTPLYFILLHLI